LVPEFEYNGFAKGGDFPQFSMKKKKEGQTLPGKGKSQGKHRMLFKGAGFIGGHVGRRRNRVAQTGGVFARRLREGKPGQRKNRAVCPDVKGGGWPRIRLSGGERTGFPLS